MQNILLASFSCKLWPIARQDRRITAAIASKVGIDRKNGTFKKYRLNPKTPEWLDITRNRDAFRTFHYSVTIPYKHGAALLNPLALDEYQERFAWHQAEHDRLVAALFDRLDEMKAEAKASLTTDSGECFYREADYSDLTPDAFAFDGLIEPLVHDATFDRFADLIGAEKAQELAEVLAEENKRAFQASCESVAERITDTLKRASDRLHNAERWNDSSITALRDLTDMLPVLNITNDPEIERTRKELSALFRAHSVESVKDKGNRASCASRVDSILAKFPGR